MKHVLITGGAGFIGSHLCERFLAEGYAVTAMDNYLTSRPQNLDGVRSNPKFSANFNLVEWDVSRPFTKDQIPFIAKHGLAGVLHFACPASPVDFDQIPYEILEVDSLGTFNTVGLALEFDARYIVASTSEIYGDPLIHPQQEEYFGNVNTIGPRACYDETKRFAEALVSTAIRGVGRWKGQKNYKPLNGGMVRIFNTYGPRLRPDDGRVVPELVMRALRGETLTIHGNGKQTRSFCFVTDLVDGIFKLYESKETRPVNIGNPVERSILEFAEVVRELTGSKSQIEFLPGREDDPKQRCPDITRAKSVLGWSPKVDLRDGLRAAIEYFQKSV